MHKFASHCNDLSMFISRLALSRIREGTNRFMTPDSGTMENKFKVEHYVMAKRNRDQVMLEGVSGLKRSQA